METGKKLLYIHPKVVEPLVTFFMIVTNRDIFVADASVKQFKYVRAKFGETLPFLLFVYTNGLTEKNYDKFCRKWERLPYVRIKKYVCESKYVPGSVVENFDKSATKLIEGPYKPGAVIWDEELSKISTPYFCTIDADFEILKPDFVKEMVDLLENDNTLAGISTDFTPTQPYFDTYSNCKITFHQRWNTWCCMYRKDVNRCKKSHFARKIKYSDGEHCHDDTGYFQEQVQKELQLRFDVLDIYWQKDFIHYGAFSKNRDVKGYLPTLLYRKLAQLRKKGVSGSGNIFWKYPDLFIRKCAAVIFSWIYNSSVTKRLHWDFSANNLDNV